MLDILRWTLLNPLDLLLLVNEMYISLIYIFIYQLVLSEWNTYLIYIFIYQL